MGKAWGILVNIRLPLEGRASGGLLAGGRLPLEGKLDRECAARARLMRWRGYPLIPGVPGLSSVACGATFPRGGRL